MAVRGLILATPFPSSLAQTVTTALYSTTVSQALRQTVTRTVAGRTSENAVKAKFAEFTFQALR